VLRGDGERVRQILLNLVANAIKFTAQGEIRVRAEGHGGSVTISVEDTGRGIPGDRLEAIFDPFVQVDRNLTPDGQQGVGLGLAISRELATGMGGTLTAESEPGRGSRFVLTLPGV
jgi:signal transduction histidine kinase